MPASEIEVHLYGRLRRYGPTQVVSEECTVRAVPEMGDHTVGDLVARLGIPESEVASVFRDGTWMLDGLATPLGKARRLGLFPREMVQLYV